MVTSVYFQKGPNPQIVENKEIHRNKYKNRRVKLMWVLRFYLWHLSLTIKLSEFRKCNVVILKHSDILSTMESGFRPFWGKNKQTNKQTKKPSSFDTFLADSAAHIHGNILIPYPSENEQLKFLRLNCLLLHGWFFFSYLITVWFELGELS